MDEERTVEGEPTAEEWTVLDSAVEYETGWYTGGYDRVEQPDGTEKTYYWAELPPAAVVVACHGGDVLFVEQYRPAIRKQCLELPAGIVEDGESFAEAGARELREETGYEAGTVEEVESFWCSTGVLRHRRGVVVARDLAESAEGRDLDTNEFITVRRIPRERALARAREDPASDATLEGLLLAAADGGVLTLARL